MSYNLLKGKKGIIFGALDPNSIAWKTAERVHEEGGEFVLTNAPIAMRMGQINELAEKTGSQIIPADATSEEDLQHLVEKSMEILGGKIDFVLHSIGMSVNVRKGRAYTDQKYDWTQKGTDVSAMSFHKVMSALYKNDAMNEWGSIVALTYMAAQRVFPDYNDMADNKAYLESVARSFGYFFGKYMQIRQLLVRQIKYVIHLFLWNSQGMSFDLWSNIQKCIVRIILRYFIRRNLSIDNFRKYGSHT